MRTIFWDDQTQILKTIDQSCLPAEFRLVELRTYQDVTTAIRTMIIRGAPIIGVSAAFGMAVAARQSQTQDLETMKVDLRIAAQELIGARPTAVNLAWAVNRMLALVETFSGSVDELRQTLLQEAQRMADEDVETNLEMARFGAELVHDGDHILHHCNTGALAAVDYGTALGVIRMAYEQGKNIHVYVDETRPRLQGSRLTAWELSQYGISYDIIVDSSSGYMMRSGRVDKVLFGADRVAVNGDVINKIGTYMLALAAYDNGIPAYSVFPLSTVDFECPTGEAVSIEERDQDEVLSLELHGVRVAPDGATARNFAFDITPHRLLSGLITERGVLYPPFFRNLAVLRQFGRRG